jgi:hypothetical protein
MNNGIDLSVDLCGDRAPLHLTCDLSSYPVRDRTDTGARSSQVATGRDSETSTTRLLIDDGRVARERELG